ncbi:hypothetical protein USDA257_p02890 (plasmid) [Sinorhizobium fredii USDA 257]|uniref:Uncharacterized protein n=1 Tax=Sinorhizobium fredii (strain USDA 257) TaxID=1185652 RepID=I3XGJ8_SINF2|nr:hypothetical protein USDA257_p02890 [Sinorhizobium fredii USDA 257]
MLRTSAITSTLQQIGNAAAQTVGLSPNFHDTSVPARSATQADNGSMVPSSGRPRKQQQSQ